MIKTLITMIKNSKLKIIYLVSLISVIIIFNIAIYNNILNFTILMLIQSVAILTTLILYYELITTKNLDSIYSYLKTIKSTNYILSHCSISIFCLTTPFIIITSFFMNAIYINDIFIIQQVVYLLLILIGNLFYTYFLLYIAINVNNKIIANCLVCSVTIISLLSLITRNLSTFLMYIVTLGLFVSISIIKKRFNSELKYIHDKEGNL